MSDIQGLYQLQAHCARVQIIFEESLDCAQLEFEDHKTIWTISQWL
jgi:hypothetical protein